MDTGELEIGHVKREVDCNHFIEVPQADTVKLVSCKVNIVNKCGRYDESFSETDPIDHKIATYSYQEQTEEKFDANKPNPEYNTKQIKNENNIDIFYEDIKLEIGEEISSELSKFCEVCYKSFSSETEFDSKNNRSECSCRKQNDSINQQSEDVKPSSLTLTTDFGSQLHDKKISQVLYGNNQVSLAASQRGLGPFFKNGEKFSELKTYEIFHTGEKPYHCKVCSKTFIMNSKNVKIHERIHAGVKPFYCKICSKYMSSLQNLKSHKRIHTGEKPYLCQICSKSFRNLQNLKNHERMHTGETPFQCKICSKYFSSLQNSKTHETIHTGETPFHCKFCSNSFSSLQILKVHEKVHSEDKPYCKICSKYFSCMPYFRIHSRIHTGEKPYCCKLCPKSFRTLQHWKVHENIHTRENPLL